MLTRLPQRFVRMPKRADHGGAYALRLDPQWLLLLLWRLQPLRPPSIG